MILPDHAHLGVVIPRLIIINMAYQGTEFEGYGSNCFKNITKSHNVKTGDSSCIGVNVIGHGTIRHELLLAFH